MRDQILVTTRLLAIPFVSRRGVTPQRPREYEEDSSVLYNHIHSLIAVKVFRGRTDRDRARIDTPPHYHRRLATSLGKAKDDIDMPALASHGIRMGFVWWLRWFVARIIIKI